MLYFQVPGCIHSTWDFVVACGYVTSVQFDTLEALLFNLAKTSPEMLLFLPPGVTPSEHVLIHYSVAPVLQLEICSVSSLHELRKFSSLFLVFLPIFFPADVLRA